MHFDRDHKDDMPYRGIEVRSWTPKGGGEPGICPLSWNLKEIKIERIIKCTKKIKGKYVCLFSFSP
jgi:hypothetical protein